MTQTRRHIYISIINVFWLCVWSPGLLDFARSGEAMRIEDWLNPMFLVAGVLVEWSNRRAGLIVNCTYYVGYALWLLLLSVSRSRDVHQGLAFVLIGVPYLLSAVAIVILHRKSRNATFLEDTGVTEV